MKRPLAAALLVNVLMLVFAQAAFAAPELQMLAPGVYALVGGEGKTNSGFVVTEKGVIVIDTQGPAALAKLLREKIKETTDKPVSHVINTHYHGDHTFGNQYFAEGLIIAHENTRKALIEKDEGHRAMFRKFFGEESLKEFSLTLPEATFTDRMILRSGGRTMELVYAGAKAHTGGDIFVWLPEERVLFAGDLLYNGRLPLLNDGETVGALKAIDKITSTDAVVLVPGHGQVSTIDDALRYKGYIGALRAEVKRMMAEGMSREEVVSKVSLPAYSSWLMYKEWLPANAARVFDELSSEKGKKD
jgi:cyclase